MFEIIYFHKWKKSLNIINIFYKILQNKKCIINAYFLAVLKNIKINIFFAFYIDLKLNFLFCSEKNMFSIVRWKD